MLVPLSGSEVALTSATVLLIDCAQVDARGMLARIRQ